MRKYSTPEIWITRFTQSDVIMTSIPESESWFNGNDTGNETETETGRWSEWF